VTKKERLKLERAQLEADVAEHNRRVLGGDWEDRSRAEKKMYPHRVLTKREHIPVKDQEPQLINTPRKSRSLKQQKEYLESSKKKHGLTSRGKKELSEVNKAINKREGILESRGLIKKKSKKKSVRDLMSGEKIKTRFM
jgi:uncharacterized C2H2 Zn-finger protein